jgi:hypothetical protein
VQHDQLFKVDVAHRAKEFVLLPDRIGHSAGSLAGRWRESFEAALGASWGRDGRSSGPILFRASNS